MVPFPTAPSPELDPGTPGQPLVHLEALPEERLSTERVVHHQVEMGLGGVGGRPLHLAGTREVVSSDFSDGCCNVWIHR